MPVFVSGMEALNGQARIVNAMSASLGVDAAVVANLAFQKLERFGDEWIGWGSPIPHESCRDERRNAGAGLFAVGAVIALRLPKVFDRAIHCLPIGARVGTELLAAACRDCVVGSHAIQCDAQ